MLFSAVVTQMVDSTAKLEMFMEIPANKPKTKTETHWVMTKTKTCNCSMKLKGIKFFVLFTK